MGRTSSKLNGLALTELVLALLMTAVLVSVGVSAFQTYSARAQINRALNATTDLRTDIARLYARERRTPSEENGDWAREAPSLADGHIVASLQIVHGRIDLVFGGRARAPIAGRVLSLTPYETATLEIIWICGNRIPGPGLEPLGFSAGGPQAEQRVTTIEARYLPPECR